MHCIPGNIIAFLLKVLSSINYAMQMWFYLMKKIFCFFWNNWISSSAHTFNQENWSASHSTLDNKRLKVTHRPKSYPFNFILISIPPCFLYWKFFLLAPIQFSFLFREPLGPSVGATDKKDKKKNVIVVLFEIKFTYFELDDRAEESIRFMNKIKSRMNVL